MQTEPQTEPERALEALAVRILSVSFKGTQKRCQAIDAVRAERVADTMERAELHGALEKLGAKRVPRCAARLAMAERAAWKALHDAALAGDASAVAELLSRPTIDLGPQWRVRCEWNEESALRAAAGAGHIACVQLLMPHCDPNAPGGSNGWDALMHATAFGHVECIDALVPWANAHRLALRGGTALMIAANDGRVECIQRLLPVSDARAMMPEEKWTALTIAVKAGHVECARLLLPRSDANAASWKGLTALKLAAFNGSADLVELLMPHSDLRDPEHFAFSALMLAAVSGQTKCVDLLLPASDAAAKNVRGETALMRAAKGNASCVELLLPHSEPQARDLDGRSALGWAIDGGRAECADLLAFHSDPAEVEKAFEIFGPAKMPRWHAQVEFEALGPIVGACSADENGRAVKRL